MKQILDSSLGLAVSPTLCAYAGNRLESRSVLRPGGEETPFSGAVWRCRQTRQDVAPDGVDLQVEFEVTTGSAPAAGVALVFECRDWDSANYVLLPGAVYNGNRFRCLPMAYPPLFRDPGEHRADVPVTITDVPHLRLDEGLSRIEQTTGDPSTPCIGFWSASRRRGVLIFTDQQTRFSNSGLTVTESDDRTAAEFAISAPCVREFRSRGGGNVPSEDCGAVWEKGDTLTLHARIHTFDAPTLQYLFDRFCELRKVLTGPTTWHHGLPFAAAWQIQENKYNRDNWDDACGYYSVGLRESLCQDWQIGWVGGCMVTLPLLSLGSELSRTRAWRNLDVIFRQAQAPSGFFYGIGDGTHWYGDGFLEPHPFRMHMVRKSADTLAFFIKQFRLIEARGHDVPETWQAGARRLADAFVRLWETSGQFGQFVDVETGELLVGGSTAGAMAPAGLALAAAYFDTPRYLAVATAAAEQYVARDMARGITTGGPGEILQGPDSESAFALLESLTTLWQATGSETWLALALDMVRQCATWCVSYDYRFPDTSLFGRLDMHTTGSVIANVQNKHGAPGICTLSGDSLLRLFRGSGDAFCLELLRDIAHNITQYLSRDDRPVGDMPSGWMNERVNLSDWEGPGQVGGIFRGTTWAEVACMLTVTEIPGVYVRTDTDECWAFDHVEANCERTGSGLTLHLTNPTSFEAEVSIFAESGAQASQPLGAVDHLRWQHVTVAPGGETRVVLPATTSSGCPSAH